MRALDFTFDNGQSIEHLLSLGAETVSFCAACEPVGYCLKAEADGEQLARKEISKNYEIRVE